MNSVFFGVVEDRSSDPFRLTRYRVRILGVHSPLKSELATEDLPWATPIQNNSAAMSGVGSSGNGYLPGSTVACIFADEDMQSPLILGGVAGMPMNAASDFDALQDTLAIIPPTTPPQPQVKLPTGEVKPASEVTNIPAGSEVVEPPYIGSLTNTQVTKLKAAIAQHESGTKGYSAENSLGFLGKYQFGATYLEDMGYIKKGSYARIKNNLKVVSDKDNWTGKDGITDKEVFKQKIDIQENLMTSMLKRNYTILRKFDAVSASTPSEKLGGALMAAHLKGAGGARDYIKRGINGKDAYGTSCEKYYQLGYAAVSGQKTAEVPTPENINSQAIDKNEDTGGKVSKYDVSSKSYGKEDLAFKDPSGKYPLKNHDNEPDTPRLTSVQKVSQTIVGEKEADRTYNVPVANSSQNWDQSPVPYNAEYPYNNVYVSESGHVMEFDDTKGRERVNLHHMAGTFVEIDAFGNQTNKVKGIRTIIVEEDELVNIQGSGHVAIVGDMSVRIGGECQIEIVGNARMRVHGNLRQEVDGDMELKVGGNYTQDVRGNSAYKTAGTYSEQTVGAHGVTTGGAMNLKASGNINADGTQIHLNSGAATAVSLSDLPTATVYAPVINIPAPVTRSEEIGIVLEEDHETAARVNSSKPQEEPKTAAQTDDKVGFQPHVTATCDFTELTLDTQLTKNYRLKDLVVGKWGPPFPFNGTQNGFTDKEIACNLKQLAINVIEPLREKYSEDGFMINSCFRARRDGKSFHESGCAVDIGFSKLKGKSNVREEYYKRCLEIRDLIPYDKIIMEYDGAAVWIHIQFKTDMLRRQTFTYNGGAKYANGLVLLA